MSTMNAKNYFANITATLAAGSVASPYQYLINITQKLCKPSCVEQTPVFAPVFSLVGITQVGVGQFLATIHVEGVISYAPCDGNVCCTKSQLISQDFTIPIAAATVTTVTLAKGTTINTIAGAPCKKCSRNFVSESPLVVTVA